MGPQIRSNSNQLVYILKYFHKKIYGQKIGIKKILRFAGSHRISKKRPKLRVGFKRDIFLHFPTVNLLLSPLMLILIPLAQDVAKVSKADMNLV
jgi:hypothetical protein